jgi:hypothetical protein
MAYNELSAGPLLSRGQVDPVADHGGVLVAKVVGHALGADGALGLDVVCNRTTNSSRLPDVYLGTCQKFQFGYFFGGSWNGKCCYILAILVYCMAVGTLFPALVCGASVLG